MIKTAELSRFIPMVVKSSRKIRAKFIRKGKFYVYIVECSDGTYYTGYTNDLERRINEHNNSCGRGAKYLKGKTPLKLVYVKEYNYYRNAVRVERDIKKRTRMEKEAMIKAYAQSREKLAPQICCANLSGGLTPKRLSVYIKTFGCQMNVRDSEVICGLLRTKNYALTTNPDEADVVILNTCSVRQHAENRVWNAIDKYSDQQIIGVVGCMAQNYQEQIFEKSKKVDFVVGPQDIAKIPEVIEKLIDHKIFERKVWETDGEVRPEKIYHHGFYQDQEHAFVVISEGCSNFCSYCVVPYVRGPLRNRNYKDILKEIEEAIVKGITRITLLGQNVNAYKSTVHGPQSTVNFVALLKMVNEIEGLEEFSFMTSHPKDTTVELFKTMEDLDKLKKHLHLPIQSGSDKILKLMNRGYDKKLYLDLVKNYRKIIKDGSLTTDIIVGFPNETEKDFQDTYDLIKKIQFNAAYIFKYSPRPHTKAQEFIDTVEKKEKERRHRLILDLQREISKKKK
ncbi:MAG: tRNA (N6-isopentenyl adenosine(37)-C2)-methylthiotransferase MiaB [Omnitrophica WOR_2 bacterium RBG_13_41_10]|nr:MAG: tRNA (N6-isopentenyl adenosine(37)-C2)-methylthiotransferase MiaB [Omnitrophica WOR_2 bacterium RBG_13_41_10]